ncbi:hypothetical protein BD626DRAFT_559498 [Schizophyllum amplum]|uniref:Glutathione S-transferase n=1 Tax=Schizophyllum amplum TaxID=97359 RepID=A0A550C423_9AGAR|nr:hypothetical protein BD626DRAFT_559498 [Auriculariopsis ampla]
MVVQLPYIRPRCICPYAHRAEIALAETGLPFKKYEIDLKSKPEWYPQVNPIGQVPAITYGGPDVPPDHPPPTPPNSPNPSSSPSSSMTSPRHPLLPTDPVLRAKARYFAEAFSSRVSAHWYASCLNGEPFDKLFDGLESLQSLLPAEGKYAVGDEYTIADIAVTPFLARLEVALREDVGMFPIGEGPVGYKTLMTGPRFSRLRDYFANLKARESFKKTFDENYFKQAFAVKCGDSRKS